VPNSYYTHHKNKTDTLPTVAIAIFFFNVAHTSQPKLGPVARFQLVGITGGKHGGGAAVARKPTPRIVWLLPLIAVRVAKLVALVIGEEGFDALFAKVGGTKRSRP